MKIKQFLRIGAATVLSLGSLLTVGIPTALAAGPFTCTWTGGEVGNNNFSAAANWSGCNSAAPQPADGDNLIFPLGVSNLTPNNDLSSAVFGSITFNGTATSGGYAITGNSMTSGNIADNSTNSFGDTISNNIALNSDANVGGTTSVITLSGSLTTTHNLNLANVTLSGAVTGTGSTVTIGSGVDFTNAGTVTFSGTITVNGELTVDGPFTGAVTVSSGGTLKGSGGTISGPIVVNSGGTIAPGHSPGCLQTGSLTVNGTYQAEIGGTTACTDYDQITATSTADIANATLRTSLVNGFTPASGQTFTIINNTGSSPITGTFSGLAEGATFNVSGYTFKISYAGGDGNDAVLTVVGVPAAAAAGAPGTPDTGFGLIAAHPVASLASSITMALVILAIARRLKPAQR
jgi:hypothetical protein